VDELLSKKKRIAAAANAIDSLLKTTLEKASVAMQRWTLLQPGSLVLFWCTGHSVDCWYDEPGIMG